MICWDNLTHGSVGGWVVGWVSGWERVKWLTIRISLDLIKIIQFCLKIWWFVKNSPPMDGCMVGWLGGLVSWVNEWDQVKWLTIVISLDLNQDNSILFEDLWFVQTPPPLGGWVDGWLGGWVSGLMGRDRVKWLTIVISLDLIEIIQFCLKIYDL